MNIFLFFFFLKFNGIQKSLGSESDPNFEFHPIYRLQSKQFKFEHSSDFRNGIVNGSAIVMKMHLNDRCLFGCSINQVSDVSKEIKKITINITETLESRLESRDFSSIERYLPL